MIEEIGKMIAAMLALLSKGDTEEAQKLYIQGLKRGFDINEDTMLDMDIRQLRAVLENKFGESFEGLEVLAGLISAGGDLHLKNHDQEKAKECYLKSMQLYKLVDLESATYSLARQAQMGKVEAVLRQLD